MITKDKFSVLISLYDKERPEFLAQCFDSLVKQTLQADEIVLVFDGQINVNLQQVVQNFQTKLPIIIVKLAQNVGLGQALAYGLNVCQHEWVARFDSDDICVPNRFEQQIAFIQIHPNIDVVGGQIIEFEEDITRGKKSRTVPISHDEITQYAKSRNPINHMTVMYRKSAVLAVGNYRHAPMYEDYDLWVRLLQAGYRFANLSDVLVYARAGEAMYERRGGLAYAKTEWQMQQRFYQQGFLGLGQVVKNLLIRVPIRLLPNTLRAWIYKNLLRQ